MPSRPAVSISECATLLPSPTNASFRPSQSAEAFLDGLHVGQRLAGMIQVAQRVDHRHVRPLRQFLDRRLREDPRHDALRPAVQIAGDILDRLALADRARRR